MLVEHFVCTGSHTGWNGEPEGLGHHAVDGKLVARRLLHWKICWPSSLENAIDENSGALRDDGVARPIRDQGGAATTPFPGLPWNDERKPALDRERPDPAEDDVGDVSDGEDGAGARRER